MLNEGIDVPIDVRDRLKEAHNRPVPRVKEGQALLKAGGKGGDGLERRLDVGPAEDVRDERSECAGVGGGLAYLR